MKTKRFLIAVLLVIGINYMNAQSGSVGSMNARSSALGKTYTAITSGISAVGKNPASLVDMKDKQIQLITFFPSFNFRAGTSFATIDEYNYFFGGETNSKGETVGKYLNADDKDRLRDIFDGGGFLVMDFSTQLLAVSYKPNDKVGAFAFGISDIAAGKVNFPTNIINVLMDGNLIHKVYDFNDTDFKSWYIRKYSFSYSRILFNKPERKFLKNLSAGISFNFVSGFAYAGLERMNSYLTTNADNTIEGRGEMKAYSAFSPDFGIKYDFDSTAKKDFGWSLFPRPAGSGFGVDIGFFATINDAWSAGLSITDMGSIRWKENAAEFSSNSAIYLDDIANKEQRDSLIDKLTGEGQYTDNFSTALATALHFGVALKIHELGNKTFPGKLTIAADYNQGFNNQPRNSKKPRVSFGAEWIPGKWIVAFRTGFSFGGADTFGWAAGLGLDFGIVELSGAMPDFHYLFMPASAKRIAFSVDAKWKF
ncbi:MAG TPA: DUF5723 family protein [Ignavibacteriaceae bacterium]|jgi:hypothetical protein|nr:DUF5723 family protein [Ignavibacteriaceae bacterium]